MKADAHPKVATWHPAATAAAWLVPGMGHVLLGERRRGLIIGTTIALVWLGGLLIGGVSVIDSTEHRAWYLGQLLVAPSVASNYAMQKWIKPGYHDPGQDEPSRFEPSYGRVREQGIL